VDEHDELMEWWGHPDRDVEREDLMVRVALFHLYVVPPEAWDGLDRATEAKS
jgi:hypothetical protein